MKKKSAINILLIGPLPLKRIVINQFTKRLQPDIVIFVDGGIKYKKMIPMSLQKRSISLGDGDSIPKNCKERLDIKLPMEKDLSDLSFALLAILKSKIEVREISILGFSLKENEKRIDHMLFNIGEILKFSKKMNLPINLDNRYLITSSGKFEFKREGLFSLISFEKNQVTLTGDCKYQLPVKTKLDPFSSHGLSNVGYGKIIVSSSKPLVVYFPN